MTLKRIAVLGAILALGAPARAAEDVEMRDAFAATFGERGAVLVSADKPEHPPGCDCAGAPATVTLDVLPEALFSRDGRRYVLVASESDIHASHADPGAIAVAYVERTKAGWRTERVWREIAWSGSNGNPADRVVRLQSHEPRIAVFRGGGGQGQFENVAWIISTKDDGPRLLGYVPIGGYLEAESCPSCSHYAYDGAIGPPTHQGAALSVTYSGWTSTGGPKQKTPFAVVVDYDEADGTLKPERDPHLPDGVGKVKPGDDSPNAKVRARLPPDTPRAFADQIIALFGTPSQTAEDGRLWDRWQDTLYDPDFQQLIDDNRELEARPPGDLFLDHDPICDCQATPSFARILSVTPQSNDEAEVEASFCFRTNLRPPQPAESCDQVDMIIKRIDGAWKLYDVGPGSLRESLTRENDRRRGEKISFDDQ